MQNIFIAIIQQGFNSLKDSPPKRVDESDEEEEPDGPIDSVIRKKKISVKKLKEAEESNS